MVADSAEKTGTVHHSRLHIRVSAIGVMARELRTIVVVFREIGAGVAGWRSTLSCSTYRGDNAPSILLSM